MTYEGETYETVVIGTQTWMARNLNYAVKGSKCYDGSNANCDIYGRLYNWPTAMNIDASCGSETIFSCGAIVLSPHRGVCPSGWHIPSSGDWYTLKTTVGFSTAGRYLKATSGWYKCGNDSSYSFKCEDKYGFAALPGGYGSSAGYFHDAGYEGRWWSSNTYGNTYDTYNAENYRMYYPQEDFNWSDWERSTLFSVRCLQDSNYSSGGGQSSIIHGTPVTYEGETYETVVIGTQTWMARNLNYAVGVSKCYNESNANCKIYGRFYDWATAMNIDASCGSKTISNCGATVSSPHQGICPSGWHIPSNADWDNLMRYVDGTSGTSSPYTSPAAGKYLKATSGWNEGGNGEDKYGFSALPGGDGGYGSYHGSLDYAGSYGYWWSSTEGEANNAYGRTMSRYNEGVNGDNYSKRKFSSVRCLQD